MMPSGGSGYKHTCNRAWASVIRYLKLSGWMTFWILRQLISMDGRIKWLKYGYYRRATRSPLLSLDDDTLTHIVGFLGHGILVPDTSDTLGASPSSNYNQLLRVVDAARLFTQIASICKRLCKFSQRRMKHALGSIDADFDGIKRPAVVPCILWLTKYKLTLGRIKLRTELADIPLMCHLLTECDTTQVTYVQAYRIDSEDGDILDFRDSMDDSHLIRPAWMARFGGVKKVVRRYGIKTYPDIHRMASDLRVPFRYASWKELHDTLAEQCPNVAHLALSVKIPPTADDRGFWSRWYFSFSLFKMPSVRHLELNFGFCVETMLPRLVQIDSCFMNAYIQGLKNLASLDIECSIHFTEYIDGQRFHVSSENLRSLNVERLPNRMWVSVSCPNLEQFVCNGSWYGNGNRPSFSYEEICRHRGDVLCAGAANWCDLEVPDECKCILRGFGMTTERCRDYSGMYYNQYLLWLEEIHNAQLITYDNA